MTFSSCSVFGLGVFPCYQDAEVALLKLKRSHFPVEQISFLAQCDDRHDALSAPFASRRYSGLLPSASNPIPPNMVSSLNGLVDHPNQFTLSSEDAVVAGGRLGSVLSSSKAFGGSIVHALQALGVSEEDAHLYCDRLRRGDCLVGVESAKGDLAEAEKILQQSLINHWQIYHYAADPCESERSPEPWLEPVASYPTLVAPPVPLATSASLMPPWPLTPEAGVLPVATAPADLQYLGVGVFRHYHETDMALQNLMLNGCLTNQVSVITGDTSRVNDFHTFEPVKVIEPQNERSNPLVDGNLHDVTNPQVGKGATTGALVGGSVGGLAGLFVGLGTLALPGVGPVLLAGVVGTAIATTLAGGAIGAAAGGLMGAMVGFGIPEDRAQAYQARLTEGHYVVLITGTAAEISKAETLLAARGIEEWGVYPLSAAGRTQLEQNRTSPEPSAVPAMKQVNA